MARGRSTWEAAIRWASAWSVLAAAAAAILYSVGVRSETAIVLGVIVIGFATSWSRSGRIDGSPVPSPARSGHRVVTVRARGHSPVS